MINPPRAFQISGNTQHPVLSFAREELARWLSAAGLEETVDAEASWRFVLAVDREAAPGAFGFAPADAAVRVWGADETCVLHAVYTLLEEIGYRFQITGPLHPRQPALERMRCPVAIQPVAQLRGIRQHLNFPMDISVYPLDDALEYIRQLARLRFNHITFHSYPNQFVALPMQGQAGLAGFFFYGQRHPVPRAPRFWRAVRNQRLFCIPEIEGTFEAWEERSRLAVAWLRAVMAEAKRVGLKVQFSFEPRRTGAELSDTLVECAAILAAYPQIDVLELMTQETGGWGAAQPVEAVRATVRALFGSAADAIPALAALLQDDQPELGRLLGELGHNVLAAKHLQTAWHGSERRASVGLYCTVARYLPLCLALYDRAADGVALSLLAGHGSTATAEHVAAAGLTPAQLANVLCYSWLEFDGLMFLQQNAMPGIRSLLEQGVTARLLQSLAHRGEPGAGPLCGHGRAARPDRRSGLLSARCGRAKPRPPATLRRGDAVA